MRPLTLTFSLAFFASFSFASDGYQHYQQHCAVCHGEYGERPAWNVTEPIAGWSEKAVEAALQGYKQHTRNRYGYGDYMHPQINTYSEGQIKAIARYLASLTSARHSVAVSSH